MWIISLITLAGTAGVLYFMPDKVPMHYDLAGNVDRWGSKYENLIFPIMIICIALLMSLLAGYYEKKAVKIRDEKLRASSISNAKVLGVIGTVTTAMFAVMQGFILYGAYAGAKTESTAAVVDIGKIMCILMGGLFVVLGLLLPKTRKNSTVGVRVSWSMYNDATWKKSNRFGGIALIIAGVLTIITAVFMKNSFAATMVSLGYLLLATAVTVIYAHKVYIQEAGAK